MLTSAPAPAPAQEEGEPPRVGEQAWRVKWKEPTRDQKKADRRALDLSFADVVSLGHGEV